MNSTARSQWLLVGVLVVAFALRWLANSMLEGLDAGPSVRNFGADGVEFNALAAHLVQDGEFSVTAGQPTSFRAPGFP